ncbi:MAG: MurR/RpiR family transcriptional regulator [Fusobacteriaceae bacterium]
MKKKFLEYLKTNYNSFSKSDKKIVDFIKFHENRLAFINITEIASEVKTSPATITRFVHKLGYTKYSDFQKVFQKEVEAKDAPMKKLKTSIEDSLRENVLQDVVETNIELLKSMNCAELEKKIDTAIEWIKKSRKIYILGARGSYSLAYHLYYILKEFRDGVELLISGASDFTDKLVFSEKDDLLFAISFHPYTNFTCQVTEFFKENKNKIITLTDKDNSVLANLSDLVITSKNSGKAHTYIPSFAVLNALLLKLGVENKEETFTRLDRLEVVTKKFNIYRDN